MRLCDSFLFDPGDDGQDGRPLNRCPSGPHRGTDPARCFRCAGWVGYGRLHDPVRFAFLVAEAVSVLKQLALDYPFIHDLAHNPTRRPQNGRSGVVGDPTGNAAADPGRARIHAYTLLVDRLVEQTVRSLRHADDACGDALYTAEAPGPADHVKAPFHDSSPRLIGRPDLDDAYAAQDRRRARGEAL